jgi:hypothetical protein
LIILIMFGEEHKLSQVYNLSNGKVVHVLK